MLSGTESSTSDATTRGPRLAAWNRKFHYYSGLYLLFFVWLFALSGLLLNHSSWKFAQFWDNRKQGSYDRTIIPPLNGSSLAQAQDLMRQLEIRGEVEWTASNSDTNRLDFRATRPGRIFEIKTDFGQRRATVQTIDFNAWGIMRVLHTFTGVRMNDSKNERDWILTSIWAFAMDAVAAGLIFMVLSSLYMWYELPQKRRAGAIALGFGFLSAGLFCIGLRWLY